MRDLEPLPTDPGSPRLLRAGMLSATLAAAGHETTWFTSTFNHYSRRQRSAGRLEPGDHLAIEVLPAPGYRRNIGLRRLLHNRRFAREFLRAAERAARLPDVIVADLPTTDAASAAIGFGRRAEIPTILSIRDLWPDFFADFMPPLLRPFVRLGVMPLDRQARFACGHADSLIGISEEYLNWGQAKGARRRTELDRVFPLGFLRPPDASAAETAGVLERLGVGQGQRIVSFVGSWGATYDLELVLETARRLTDRRDIVFVLAGNASERPELKRAFEALPNTVLPGWLGPDEVAALLGASDVGLLPYAKNAPQGLPNKVYEYMAYGTYQVATLTGEAENLYAETAAGRSIADATPASLAAAIGDVLAAPEIAAARTRRREIFDTRFDARKVYAGMTDHIVEVAATRAARRG
ncbi:glycosyltransferase [Nitratireductor pacificus]|uniref:Group 1 glycosyl transferase n=1 Tax=Nitratireductor pacificus pht-3B TaxID=391937 RepID=K2M8Q7_9HYPH|nr:glycosyltransferase [Nitratireductor pacificus]EKF17390.1 group 1 glycosyl transferase [Nitratireductor pacificus pht-3B]